MSPKESLTFENAISRLEELTNQLENGSLTLDQSLEVFKEAITLTKFCENKLQNVQNEIITVENSEYIPEESSENEKNNSKSNQNTTETKKKTKKTTSSDTDDDNQGSLF